MRSLHTSVFAIGLFGDRLELALWRRGRVIASRRRAIALETRTDLEQWCPAVRDLAPIVCDMIREIVSEANIHARRALVVYASPSAVGDCMSFPVRTAAQARAAAALAVMDSMPSVACAVLCETLFVERDAAPPAPGRSKVAQVTTAPKPDGRSQRAHVVAAAECENALIAIQSMVEGAGLRFGGAVPIQAAIAARALARAADRRSTLAAADREPLDRVQPEPLSAAVPTAHLHIAEAGSFLLIRDGQTESKAHANLRFTRSIPIGAMSLAASLMRGNKPAAGMSREDSDQDTGEAIDDFDSREVRPGRRLDPESARRALYEFGLPSTPDAVHEATGLTVRDVLPLLQPLVQRLTVELRQSLRFALDPAERSRASLIVSGPGADVPGLAAALGREAGVPSFVQRPTGERDAAPGPVMACADLVESVAAWLSRASNAISELALQPRELAIRAAATRIRRGLWAGAAAALLLIALDAGRLASHLVHARSNHDAVSAAIQPAANLSPLLQRVDDDPDGTLATIDSARQFRAAVERETSRRVDFHACMHELSRITPQSVRFTNLNLQPVPVNDKGGERLGAVLAGVARPAGDTPARTELERFVHELRTSPLFDDVSLANVHVESDGSFAQRFEVRFAAMTAPGRAWQNPGDRERRRGPAADVAAVSEGAAE